MSLPTIAGVQSRIHTLPGRPPIMTKDDLAEFYGTTASNFMRRVRENEALFTSDLMFELTPEEQQLCRGGTTAERKRTDLAQYGFTELGALMAATILKSQRSKEVAQIVIRGFVGQRDALMAAMRRELAVDRQAYINARNIRGNIDMAAREGWNFIQLQDRIGYSPKVLTMEIEAMRTRGYIPAMALTPPLYVLRQIEAKRAFTAVHVEDAEQLRLGLEG